MNKVEVLVGVVCWILVVLFSILSPGNTDNPFPWNHVSSFLGWTYFFAWSVSFYFQIFLNFSRGTATGLSTEFLLYNLFGFACYGFYNCAFYFDAEIREEYRDLHHGRNKLVALSDVVFSLHAFTITLITMVQVFFCGFEREKVSMTCVMILVLQVIAALVVWLIAEKLVFLDFVGMLKLFVSTIKYLPQAYMNYKNKSTEGWSIKNILLDFSGGSLSILQLIIDGVSRNDVEGIFANPAKLGLSFVSIGFDILFITQHYVFYRKTNDKLALESSATQESSFIEEQNGYEKLLQSEEEIEAEGG